MTETAPINGTRTIRREQWWKSAVVYQVYPKSFADSDGDGIGDLRGIIQHLDHLERLGVDVIWLSPIYASPHADNGYDISDYQAVDPMFGTLDDFDELVAGLHTRGMRLLMDLVVNHTSSQHPWFLESAAAPQSAKRDWYWWRPPRPGHVGGTPGAEPTNWESFFGGPAWTYDPKSGEYYLHLFSPEQPDLNWENPAVRQAVYGMMRWWLSRGVDGFRMDVINLISKDTSLPDGSRRRGSRYGDGFPHYGHGPRVHEYLHEMNEAVFGVDASCYMTVGEMPGVTVDQAKLFTDQGRRELDMVFQFEHVDIDHGPDSKWDTRPFDLIALKRVIEKWQEGLSETGWNSLYWNNHDQPRVVSRFGDDGEHRQKSAQLLGTVLHMLRGTPFIYQGEELGMTNAPLTELSDLRDVESLNYFAAESTSRPHAQIFGVLRKVSRDNARTPMQWSADINAGFTDGRPWMGVNPNFLAINAEIQYTDPESVFEYYRRLIAIRHDEPIITTGRFSPVLPDDPRILGYKRTTPEQELLVLANFASVTTDIRGLSESASWTRARRLIGNYEATRRLALDTLRPWEAVVLLRDRSS